MSFSGLAWEQVDDLPPDFETFVAHEHGLGSEQAARLIMEWMASYESPLARRSAQQSAAPSHFP